MGLRPGKAALVHSPILERLCNHQSSIPARITLKTVNEEPARLGNHAQLAKGDGCFYFWTGDAADWLDRTVKVPTLSTLTLEQWIGEFRRLKDLDTADGQARAHGSEPRYVRPHREPLMPDSTNCSTAARKVAWVEVLRRSGNRSCDFAVHALSPSKFARHCPSYNVVEWPKMDFRPRILSFSSAGLNAPERNMH